MFWFIYIPTVIVMIVTVFLYMRLEAADTEEPEKDKFKPKDYTTFLIVSLIPYINDIILALIIIILILFSINELITKYIKNLREDTKYKHMVKTNRTRNLPIALIDAGYFKNESEIDDFVDGYLVSEKLAKIS